MNERASNRDFRPPLLVLRSLGLGDLCTIVPALRSVRVAHPENRIVLACPSWLHPLAQMTGAVDNVVGTNELAAFHTRLPPTLAINLHGRGPRSHRLLLAQYPLRLLAFAHPDIPQTAGMPEWREHEHDVARWCRLLEAFGMPCRPDDLDLDARFLRGRAPALARAATVLHVGAGAPARRWPGERFAAIARHELACGHRVVLTGDERDVARCHEIAVRAQLPVTSILAGTTNVLDLVAIVASAKCVVSGDTGVAHLATALRRPSVVLCGPVPPSEWGPPRTRARNRALWAGRRGDPHGRTVDPGLLEITVADVLDALRDVSSDNDQSSLAQQDVG